MVFDILGVVNLQSHFGKSSIYEIAVEQFYGNIHFQKHYIESEKFQIFCMYRGERVESFYENEKFCIVTIGEPFLNANGATKFIKSIHKLSGQEVLKLYIDFGDTYVDYLKGNFQIVILDKNQNSILVFNSRFGVSPFYYYNDANIFIFSTNLHAIVDCPLVKCKIDDIGISEYAIFGYPLGDKTIFENIKNLLPGVFLTVKKNFLKCTRYWDNKILFKKETYTERDALEIGSELFLKTVNTYTFAPTKICISFTGGFDSRAILSVVEKESSDFLCYSFGITGSLNVSIPQKICDVHNINYMPIYLNSEYEEVFDQHAINALYFSDCLSTIERANYLYSFKRLREFSPIVVTGLFGSELMRTFQNVTLGHMVNKSFADINFCEDKKKKLDLIISDIKNNSYYNSQIFERCYNDLIRHILYECFEKYADFNDKQRFYLFLLNEGMRRYFGGEVHMERIYAVNRFPFLDDDFVEFVCKSPFAGIHSSPLRPTVKERYRSQYFYAYIIKKFRPEFLGFYTDHGYPPKYILSTIPLLKIAPIFIYSRMKQRLGKYREFKTEEWVERLFNKKLFTKSLNHGLFSRKLPNDFKTGVWKKKRLEFTRAASLKLYFDILGLNYG